MVKTNKILKHWYERGNNWFFSNYLTEIIDLFTNLNSRNGLAQPFKKATGNW